MSKKQRVTISVFLIAFAFGLNITGISPVLGVLNEKYASYGTAKVQMLQTIPYLLLMAGSFIIGYLTSRFSTKQITMAGLLVIGICGILPCFVPGFGVLMAARLVIGFGFGIVSPMNTAIIAEEFPPEERAPYMGLHVVGMGVGTMVGNLVGGLLAGIKYEYFYLVYLVAIVVMIGVAVALEDNKPTAVEGEKTDAKLNGMIYALSAASFIHTLFINAYSTNIGIYIAEYVTKNPSAAGVATAVNAACALGVGVLFGKIFGILKKYALPSAFLIASLGFLAVRLVPGMAGVYLVSAFCGISLSSFMATASYLISISVSKEAVAKASGVFSVVGSIGGLIAPMILASAAGALGGNTAGHQLTVSFVGMLAAGLVILVLIRKVKEI